MIKLVMFVMIMIVKVTSKGPLGYRPCDDMDCYMCIHEDVDAKDYFCMKYKCEVNIISGDRVGTTCDDFEINNDC